MGDGYDLSKCGVGARCALEQLTCSTHTALYNTFIIQRHPISRRTLRRLRADADVAWAAVV